MTNVKLPPLVLCLLSLPPLCTRFLLLGSALLSSCPAVAIPQPEPPLLEVNDRLKEASESTLDWVAALVERSPPNFPLSAQPLYRVSAVPKLQPSELPLQPPLVRESTLDFAARAQSASSLSLPVSDRPLLERNPPEGDPLQQAPMPPDHLAFLQAEAVAQAPAIADPDLGILRLRRSPAKPGDAADPNPLPQPNCDPELGCLRLRDPLPLPPVMASSRTPVVYLLARADYFHNSNLFSNQNPVPDGLARPGVTLYASPSLGPNTYLVASATGSLLRYSAQSQSDSNELFFRAGILQRLSPTMFGEIGWSNQQLFIFSDKQAKPPGTRFFNEHAIRLELSRRDQLTKKLSLSSFYQFRYGFADPINRSRITNALTLSLNYDLQPNLQLGLDYQLGLAHFTHQKRRDLYNQVLGRLTYTPVKNTQVSAFVGYGFGNSSDESVRFNSLLVGVSLSLTLGLF